MSELPSGWTKARLEELLTLGPRNHCADDTQVGFVPLQRLGVSFRSQHTFELRPWQSVKTGYTHFADGDVLLARITPSFENGKAGIVRNLPNGLGAGSTEYFVCRPFEGAILSEFLLAHFKMPQFLRDGQQVMSGAVGQQRVPKQYVLNSEIPLAPLNEQKRIADKLDAVLAKVDACRERLDRIPKLLKRFRQAVLAAATSGELTKDWREENGSLPWREVMVAQVANEIFDGPFGSHLKSKDYASTGLRVIRLENIGWLKFNEDKETFILPAKFESLKKHVLLWQDLLFSSFISEETRVCLLPKSLSGVAINKADCFCIRANPRVCLPNYLAFRLASRETFLSLEESVHGATRPRINLRQLKSLSLDLPPLLEQHEIVRRVETLFAYADGLEANYTAARNQVERLTPALLSKAFRGELVPQDPNDEPASALLERIRAAREQSSGKLLHWSTVRMQSRRKIFERINMPKSRLDEDVLHKPYLSDLLKASKGAGNAEQLFQLADLSMPDFYKQLAWETEHGMIRDEGDRLEVN